ncbi:hypothetical protein ABFS83_04G124900 [Erythranthe nasuta]
MGAAYAALVSLTHTIDQILNPPPHHQFINFDRDRINCLRKKADFLIDYFLENNSNTGGDHKEIEDLETRIRFAAEGAEYIIEDNVMNQILAAGSEVDRSVETSTSNNLLSEGVRTTIQEFHTIEEELVKIKKYVQAKISITTEATSSSRALLPIGENTMVGFDDHLIQIMGALSTDESNIRVISIVGMGGIGKTTLATHVYNKPFIVQHFHVCAWFTVSQEYTEKEILLGLLRQINNTNRDEQETGDGDDDYDDDDQLGNKLHKTLFGRKYLIVMDDMWDIKAWEMIKRFLPDNNNGSRILVTTRLLRLATDIGSCSPYQLNLLDEEQSWDLLSQKIYAEKCCPVELEEIGRSIAKKCRGLPLALAVIGGVLAKSKTENWKYVEEDVTSAVRNQDFDIQVSRLIRLWVAEGFIRKCGHKSLEEIGEEYLKNLIDRNLILVDKLELTGEVKTCHIHDLLSDLCRIEAQKDNFILIGELYNHLDMLPNTETRPTRLSINGGKWKGMKRTPYRPPTRSFLSFSSRDSTDYTARRFPLLRVLDVVEKYPKDEILQLINSRYVSCTGSISMSSSILSRLWSLQTLVVDREVILPSEIWQMPQLRHVEGDSIILPDPPPPDDVHKIILLENLQTLSTVEDFKCTEAVIKRIPNLKKLGIVCGTIGSNCLRNLGLLHKLKVLTMLCSPCGGEIVFPNSLKELRLYGCKIPWEEMSIIGSLPNLEVLVFFGNAATGQKWIPNEREFTRLKYLWINQCELEIWEADNTHFPCLEILRLGYLNLKEIPSEFTEILPLQKICVDYNRNNDLILASANEISEQRENLGYDGIQVLNTTFGVLKILVKRGINLAVGGDGHIGDPYVVITNGNQKVETHVVANDVNPEWDDDLTIWHPNQSHPISLTVFVRNKLRNVDEKIGEAEFDIGPLVEAANMYPNGLPNGTIITRILPSSSNCLAKESFIIWINGIVLLDMRLTLKNIDRGEIELRIGWVF